MTERATITVYPKHGPPVTIPLTGDEKHDALLERLARRGGGLLSKDGLLKVSEDETAMRDAMREGA